MNKVMLRLAFCLVLFPAVQAYAQDAKVAPGSISTGTPDEKSRSGASLSNTPDATSATDATLEEKQTGILIVQAPKFPDSLMRNYEVEVFQNVLKMADLVDLKYKDAVANAKAGDVASMYKLLDFHRVVDGVDALNHAVTCLELIPLLGDASFGAATYSCQPKLKKVLLERLVLAQGRTKKTFLRQSLADWAPVTWSYLSGQGTVEPAGGVSTQPADQKPATTPPASTPSGKQ